MTKFVLNRFTGLSTSRTVPYLIGILVLFCETLKTKKAEEKDFHGL